LRSLSTSPDLPMRYLPTCFLIAVSLAVPAYAIDPNRAMSQYVHDRWGAEQGFPRGPVYAISQSSDGYLWIGTHAGLVRFDGLNFQLLRDIPGLQNGESVFGLMPDRHGNLWIRLQGNLLRYRNGTFDIPVANLESRVTAMCISTSGDLLISVMRRGTMAYRQGKFEMVADARDLPHSPMLSIAQTADESHWIGTRGAGLFRSDHGHTKPIAEGLPDLKVNALLAGANGDLWVGTDSGIARWNGKQLAPLESASLHQLQILVMEHDRDGNVWAGTDSRGLVRINERGIAYFDALDRPRQAVTALFEDREGNLWVGGADGIERLRDSAFMTFSRAEGLVADRNNPVFVDSEGRVWFPPVSGGLWWMKGGQRGHVSKSGLDGDEVYSIAGHSRELWLGRQRGGLTRLRFNGDLFNAVTFTKADGLAQDSVVAVYQARNQTVWAGTLSGGVSRLVDGKFTTYTKSTGLLANTVTSIVESLDGIMWFATAGGLNSLSSGRWQGYTEKDGLPSNNVFCLLEDSAGVLWIGTAGGLAFRTAHGIQHPVGGSAWQGEAVLGLAEDKLGSLWMATSSHILRVNRDHLLHGALGDGDVREFGTADGLRGVEGLRRHRSVLADPNGNIWFALNSGTSVVDPARLMRNTAPAIVHVQSLTVDGNKISMEAPIHIPGNRRRVTFGFAGSSLSAPELIRFRYRLDDYDSRWSDQTSIREAGYTTLAPGRYRFRVIASNPDGVWNGGEGGIIFVVDPLWWQTWWFRAGAILAFIGGMWGFYQFRMQSLTSRLNLRFETRLAERTRIAQELHDTLLQGFLSASMQLHVATKSLPGDSPARQKLTGTLQLMRQVIDEGRNTVRGLRSGSLATINLEDAFSGISQEMDQIVNSDVRTGFRVIVEGTRHPLRPLIRDDIYRIGREAVINAFRHAGAKNIEVELRYSPRELRVLVRDDGCGIEPDILKSGRDGHWGLPGMRERAEQVGARLHVYSRAAGGTEVELAVPGHLAFQGKAQRKVIWRREKENGR
jgi:ligand-binding sensor domain-containing protein/signal transduction histidine kinase